MYQIYIIFCEKAKLYAHKHFEWKLCLISRLYTWLSLANITSSFPLLKHKSFSFKLFYMKTFIQAQQRAHTAPIKPALHMLWKSIRYNLNTQHLQHHPSICYLNFYLTLLHLELLRSKYVPVPFFLLKPRYALYFWFKAYRTVGWQFASHLNVNM